MARGHGERPRDEPPARDPVSTALRESPTSAVLALGPRRTALRELRDDPRAALLVQAPGTSFTAHGTATVVAEVEGIVAVRLAVDDVQAHTSPRFAIDDGVAWHWTDDDARAKDERVRAALRSLRAA